MLLLQTVLEIQSELIDIFGGTHGIRDLQALESAISRPFQSYSDVALYPSPQAKAAAVLQSILMNHPFIDGNKRTGYFLATAILYEYNLQITADEDSRYNCIMSIISGEMQIEAIENWFINNTAPFN